MKMKFAALGLLALSLLGSAVDANAQTVPFCQRSYPWAPYTLGFGPGTIANIGCTITGISSIECWRGWGVNPLTLNEWGKSHGGFSGNLVVWGAYPGFRELRNYDNVAADLGWVNSQLDSGKVLIVKTFMGHNLGLPHWVVIYAHWGTTYGMMDPYYGSTDVTFNARYGDPARWIYRVASFAR